MEEELTYADYYVYGCSNEASKITDYIFLGNKNAANNKTHLQSIGVTHIIRVGYGLVDYHRDSFNYLCINVVDEKDEVLYLHFQVAYDFIEQCINKGGKVFVHCRAGISRSSTIICAYLIKKQQITYESALQIIKAGRKIVQPNDGFKAQLIEWYIRNVTKKTTLKKTANRKNYCLSINSTKEKKNPNKYANLKLIGRKKPKSIKISLEKPQIKRKHTEDKIIKVFLCLDAELKELNSNEKTLKINKLNELVKKSKEFVEKHFPTKKKLSKNLIKERLLKLKNLVKNTIRKYKKTIIQN